MIKLGTKGYKILQSGERGLRIILPQEWTGDRGLKQGSLVYAKNDGNQILIIDDYDRASEGKFTAYTLRVGNCITIPKSWGYEKGMKMYRYLTGGNERIGDLVLSLKEDLHE